MAGAGKMGVNHIRIASELNNQFDLIGIFDPDPGTAGIARRHDVRFFDTYEDLLSAVEAVIIASPSSLHHDMALQAAACNIHALVEKPMAETVEEVLEIQNEFNARGLVLAVSCVERFSPVIRALSEFVKEEEIIAIEIHRCSPYDPRIFDVDVVSDLMIHDIDIVLNAIMEQEPLEVDAFGTKVFSDRFADYAHTIFTFQGNVRAFITASRCTQDKIRTVCIHAKNAYIEADMLNKTVVIKRGMRYAQEFEHISYKQFNMTEQIVLPNIEPLKEDIRNFGLAISGENGFLVAGEQIVRDMRTMDRIHSKIYKME